MSENEQEQVIPQNKVVIEAPEGSGEPDNEVEPVHTGEHKLQEPNGQAADDSETNDDTQPA